MTGGSIRARGGGALFDVGCYGVSTARLFAGASRFDPRRLAHLGPTGVDLSLTAQLEFPGGVLAAIDCSFEQPFRCSYELVGSRGVIDVPDAYLPPGQAQPTRSLRTIGSSSDSGAAADKVRPLEFETIDQYAAMVDAFAASVASGRLIEPAEDGLAQMVVLDQAQDGAHWGTESASVARRGRKYSRGLLNVAITSPVDRFQRRRRLKDRLTSVPHGWTLLLIVGLVAGLVLSLVRTCNGIATGRAAKRRSDATGRPDVDGGASRAAAGLINDRATCEATGLAKPSTPAASCW